MNDHELHKTLKQLDRELASADADDAAARADLERMRGDVQRALARPAVREEHQSLTAQLRDAIPRFESSHPTLTMAMAEVVDILNRLGI
jgi:hypothetical protein